MFNGDIATQLDGMSRNDDKGGNDGYRRERNHIRWCHCKSLAVSQRANGHTNIDVDDSAASQRRDGGPAILIRANIPNFPANSSRIEPSRPNTSKQSAQLEDERELEGKFQTEVTI